MCLTTKSETTINSIESCLSDWCRVAQVPFLSKVQGEKTYMHTDTHTHQSNGGKSKKKFEENLAKQWRRR